jgi:Chromo (CHRromatin Organisation MOdifier) domain
MLEHATLNSIPNWVQSPPPPVELDGKTEYEISEILDTKINRRQKPCSLLYLVHWAGYEGTNEETSWVLATELGHSAKIMTDFHSAYPGFLEPELRLFLSVL